MKSVSECVICHSRDLISRKGSVAPFLAYRIWGRDTFSVTLLECRVCGFSFFSPRLEEAEEYRLYADYRSEAYQQLRYSFEPWYTGDFNRSLFSEATMRSRQDVLKQLLAPYLGRAQVRAILDFGGGRGELISNLVPQTERYVYDVSDAEPLSGIEKLRCLADCKRHHYDLIVCSHVLEHVAYPNNVMWEITDLASPGTFVFVEVPYESPLDYVQRAKRLAQTAILMAMRTRVAWSLLKVGVLNMMHEHVNFFSPAALESAITTCGLEVQASGVTGDSLTDKGALWSLSRLG